MRRPTRGTDNRVLRVCQLLNRYRVRYLLAGGVAANLHGSVRATKDVDVDVLTVAWTVTFERAWPNRKVRRIDGTRIPFLSLEDLRESKSTGRASDRADLEALERLTEA